MVSILSYHKSAVVFSPKINVLLSFDLSPLG